MTSIESLRRRYRNLSGDNDQIRRLILVGMKGYLPKDHKLNDRYILLGGLKGQEETIIWEGTKRTVIDEETKAGRILTEEDYTKL